MSQTEEQTRVRSPLPRTPVQPRAEYPDGWYVLPTTNGFAIASLVLGILWVMWIGSVLAVIFGYIGKSEIERSRGSQSGTGLAIAGMVLGWVGIAIFFLSIFLDFFDINFDGGMM